MLNIIFKIYILNKKNCVNQRDENSFLLKSLESCAKFNNKNVG